MRLKRRYVGLVVLVLITFCVSCTGTELGTPKPTPTLTYEETLAEYRRVEAEVIKNLGYDPAEASKGEEVSRKITARFSNRKEILCHFCRKGCNLDLEAVGYPTYITPEGGITVNSRETQIEVKPSDAVEEVKWLALFCYPGEDSPAINEVQVIKNRKGWSWDINGVTGVIEQLEHFIVCRDDTGRVISSFEWAICDDGSGGLRVVGQICPYCPEE